MGVKERLIEYLNYKGISKSTFCATIGVSTAFISSMRKSMQPDKLAVIKTKYSDLDIGWLQTGIGTMVPDKVEYSEIRAALVKLLPISAYGGTLQNFIISVNESDCEKVISPVRGADFAITIAGDSMAPEYPNGAKILIKKINKDDYIEWGKVYVMDTTQGVVVRILAPSINEGCWRCISINTDQERYAPFDINQNSVYAVYRVLFCMAIK